MRWRPVDLLSEMQRLSLKVAGRWLLSMDLDPYVAAVRSLIGLYSRRFGVLSLLDFLLPRGVPGPRDLARLWFRRRWVALVEQILAERRRHPRAPSARDLFDARYA